MFGVKKAAGTKKGEKVPESSRIFTTTSRQTSDAIERGEFKRGKEHARKPKGNRRLLSGRTATGIEGV